MFKTIQNKTTETIDIFVRERARARMCACVWRENSNNSIQCIPFIAYILITSKLINLSSFQKLYFISMDYAHSIGCRNANLYEIHLKITSVCYSMHTVC